MTNATKLARSVSIVGVGCTPFGDLLTTPELLGMTERELVAWAALDAMADAGLTPKEIDAFFVGHCLDEQVAGSINTAPAVADWIGMRNKPGLHHEAACATGGMGLWLACQAVASGMYRTVLSVGVEVLRSKTIPGLPAHMRQAMSVKDRNAATITIDRAYGDRQVGGSNYMAYGSAYGLTLDQLEEVSLTASINARRNGARNPRSTLTELDPADLARQHGFDDAMDYMRSDHNPKMAALTRASDFWVHADGASAVIVCSTDMAKRLTERPISVTGLGIATGQFYHTNAIDSEQDAAAFAQAFEMARINPARDVDYMYVHDATLTHQFVGAETAGYLPRGEGWAAVMEGRTAVTGDRPLNTSGGRTAMGHAYGASIGAEIAEAVWQMRGECGDRQISPPPATSVVHGLGGRITSFAGVLEVAQ